MCDLVCFSYFSGVLLLLRPQTGKIINPISFSLKMKMMRTVYSTNILFALSKNSRLKLPVLLAQFFSV